MRSVREGAVGERTDETRFDHSPTEVDALPSPPRGVSRVDTLPTDFISSISRRPLMLGDLIGDRYKLIAALGDGAMGRVFLAKIK